MPRQELRGAFRVHWHDRYLWYPGESQHLVNGFFMGNIQQDIDRVILNHRNLLDVLPEMVMLVREVDSVEYMNPSALSFFGDLRRQANTSRTPPANGLTDALFAVVGHSLEQEKIGTLQKTHFKNASLEFILAPFQGYKGDRLHWLFLRNATEQKRPMRNLSSFHNSFGSVLSDGICTLDQSTELGKVFYIDETSEENRGAFRLDDGQMIGSSTALQELRDMVQQVAKSNATILITGESGTGKELVANMIREASNRQDKPFLKINCNTINDSLLESDLFGYEKGAFTGAETKHKGKFEVVDGGTIFLDEIGDISPRMQAALLRVLQEGEIIRVGGNTPIKINVRIIAATNSDLTTSIQNGTFRLDLYYRLNIINISIPPLRKRKEDILDLTTHFVKKYIRTFGKKINAIPRSLLDKLIAHDWPGNVRELDNVIQRAVLMAKSGVLAANELFVGIQCEQDTAQDVAACLQWLEGMPLKIMMAEIEREILISTLKKNKGNAAISAQKLNIGKTALYDKMKRYRISAKEYKA